jgi:hypothetical protein
MKDSYANITQRGRQVKKPPDRINFQEKSILSKLNPTFKFEEQLHSIFPNITIANFNGILDSVNEISAFLFNKYKDKIVHFRRCKRPGYYEIIWDDEANVDVNHTGRSIL